MEMVLVETMTSLVVELTPQFSIIHNKTSYGDTVKKLFDYVDNWLNERFVK